MHWWQSSILTAPGPPQVSGNPRILQEVEKKTTALHIFLADRCTHGFLFFPLRIPQTFLQFSRNPKRLGQLEVDPLCEYNDFLLPQIQSIFPQIENVHRISLVKFQ